MTLRGDSTPSWSMERDGSSTLPLRVLRLEWRTDADGNVEILNPRTGGWLRYAPNAVPILEGLEAGETLPDLVRRARSRERLAAMEERHVRRLVTSIVFGLRSARAIEVDLPPVPDVFHARYRREAELGRGGVGVAWLCRDTARAGEPAVVVKHAWNFLNALEKCERALRREAEVMRAFDHPAIVRALDEFEVDGRYHLVRDFVDGVELDAHADGDRGPPSPAARRAITRRIAEALHHVHERGYLFLDLKPQNFMLTAPASADLAPGEVKVCDVGLCRPLEGGVVRLDGATGSRGYAAPEVAHEVPVATVRSDVYGLGRVHAFLATGRRPKPKDSSEDIVAAMRERGADERELELVRRATATDPKERPADMLEVMEMIA